MDLVTKKVSKALQVTPKYLALSVQGAVMHSFLGVNPWCKKVRGLKVGRYISSKSSVY